MGLLTQYAELLEQLYLARAGGPLLEQQEYEFTCALETIWNKLGADEQSQVEAMTEEFKREIAAPEELGTDLAVALREHKGPRRAA